MASYDLAGSGVQALNSGFNHLFIDVLSFGPGISTGRAVPTNYFHVGLLRVGFQGASYREFPIDAAHMIVTLPEAYDALGYSLTPSTLIHVNEYLF